MDPQLRRQLLEKAIAMLEHDDTLVAVPLEEFFHGNDDEHSIGVNLLPDQDPGLAGFKQVLEQIRRRADVQDVLLELIDVPYPDEEADADMWPVAGVAFIITSAPLEEVTQWVFTLHPRDISEGWNVKEEIKTPYTDEQIDPGMRVVRVWLL